MADKQRILVLCTGNSCRSQMAEGWLRHLYPDLVEAYSAGSQPAGYVHPLAIRVMAEIGIDISGGSSKHLSAFMDRPFDKVITVCDSAAEACPAFPGPAGAITATLLIRRECREQMTSGWRHFAACAMTSGSGWWKWSKHNLCARNGLLTFSQVVVQSRYSW